MIQTEATVTDLDGKTYPASRPHRPEAGELTPEEEDAALHRTDVLSDAPQLVSEDQKVTGKYGMYYPATRPIPAVEAPPLIIVKKKDLLEALRRLKPACPQKSPSHTQNVVWLSSQAHTLTLIVGSPSHALQAEIPCEGGAATKIRGGLLFAALLKIIRASSAVITLTHDDPNKPQNLSLSGGGIAYRPDDQIAYTECPAFNFAFSEEGATFVHLPTLRTLLPFRATESVREPIMGINLRRQGEGTRYEATDGHRAILLTVFAQTETKDCHLPGPLVDFLTQSPKTQTHQSVQVTLLKAPDEHSPDRLRWVSTQGAYTIAYTTLVGEYDEYPPIDRVAQVPADAQKVVVSKQALVAVEMFCDALSKAGANVMLQLEVGACFSLCWTADSSGIKGSRRTKGQEATQAEEETSVELLAQMKALLNPSYIKEVIQALPSDQTEVTIYLPPYIVGKDDRVISFPTHFFCGNVHALVMPMRI